MAVAVRNIIHCMRKKDTLDVLTATIAVVVDAAAVFGGLMLATWLRFDRCRFLSDSENHWTSIRSMPS